MRAERLSALVETFGRGLWLGQETGHNKWLEPPLFAAVPGTAHNPG
jgi:hypothetical protein